MRFDNKVAIVTGGAKGIGKAIVEKIFNEGAKVVIMDIDEGAAKQLDKNLDPKEERTLGVGCEVAKVS